MHILIDAYNLIKKVYVNQFSSSNHIKRCLELLAQYALLKNHHLTIVFDGGTSAWPTSQRDSSHCCLWWAGHGATADDVIKKLLDEKTAYHLLVSCDKELVIYAQDYKIPSIESAFFWEFVIQAIQRAKERKKIVHKQERACPEKQDINEIMDEFSVEIETKDADKKNQEIVTQKKSLSKTEIQLYAIIKKL